MSNETKRWHVKAPKNWMGYGTQGWLYKGDVTGAIQTISEDNRERTPDEQFTADEIKKYHLSGFETVEAIDD